MRHTAILLVDCPDRKGLVAAIADFLYRHNANILHADQHQDAERGLFLMRVEKRPRSASWRSEEHTSELQSRGHLVCRLLLEKKKKKPTKQRTKKYIHASHTLYSSE